MLTCIISGKKETQCTDAMRKRIIFASICVIFASCIPQDYFNAKEVKNEEKYRALIRNYLDIQGNEFCYFVSSSALNSLKTKEPKIINKWMRRKETHKC